MKKVIYSENAPKPIGPYSQAILSDSLLFCSGQIPIDPATGELAGVSIREQTLQVMKNIAAVLSAVGMDFSNVVKTTCFLAGMEDFPVFNEVYSSLFTTNPARSCVAVKALPMGSLVEVEVIAQAN